MPDDTSGPAFPERSDAGYDRHGLTKREEFAGRIFAGMMGNGELAPLLVADMDNFPAVAAKAAVKAADALLAELSK